MYKNPKIGPREMAYQVNILVTSLHKQVCGCGEAASRSLGLLWVRVEHQMCLWGLGSRDQAEFSNLK